MKASPVVGQDYLRDIERQLRQITSRWVNNTGHQRWATLQQIRDLAHQLQNLLASAAMQLPISKLRRIETELDGLAPLAGRRWQ